MQQAHESTKHQRYLAGEEGSDPDSPAPKPAKATKPKATKQSMPSVPKAAPIQTWLSDKKRKPTSSLRLVDEFIDEGVPKNEPRFDDEQANLQKAVEESLKDAHATHRGPLPPVVFREPNSRRRQPLLEVQGKGKEKVIEEQAAHTLFDLYTPKKKSTIDQYILQRRTPKTVDPTGPSIHHEDKKATRVDVETGTEEFLTRTEKLGEKESNTVVLGTESSGQDKTQGGLDPGDSARQLPTQDILTGLSLDPMDEGFTATAYPNVHENLKLTVEEHVILEEPTSSTWTLSSLQHLAKDFSFGDQFFNDKSSKAKNEKTTAETKAESMVSVTIQQDASAIPPMTTLTVTGHVCTNWRISIYLSRDFPEVDIKEILHQRMWKTISNQANKDHKNLYKALEKTLPPPPPPPPGPSRTLGSSRESGSSQVPPLPPPPPSTNQEGQSHGFTAPSSSKTAPSAEYTAWTTSNTRFKSFVTSIPEELHMDDDSALDEQVHLFDDEDIRNDHIPKEGQSHGSTTPSSSKTAASAEYTAWKTSDTRFKLSVSSIPIDLHMDDDSAPDEHVHSYDDEDITNDHIPNVNLMQY
uniref:Uncharacterized protein n=1 Tax=Tanacetum cinerariifolium TaxID=118510 RepID=A0A6L2N6A6_TANCI|nr:hypothetical protein [Tanacetum cinerariifolium]